jgi:hypothetical protein
MVKLTPEDAGGPPRPKFGGLAGLLAQSVIVRTAFGRERGFIVMMTALTASLMMSMATIFVATKIASRFFG